jgi:hypothetical protein
MMKRDERPHRKRFEQFCRLSEQYFGFLKERYGFRLVEKDGGSYGDTVRYQNDTTSITLDADLHHPGVFVEIARLKEGRMPAYPLYVSDDTELNTFDLNDLIRHRGGTEVVGNAWFPEKALELYARRLEEYASDVIRGDFAVFKDLEAIVKTRARKRRW